MERLFDAIYDTNGFNFAIAVSFSGKIERPRWAAAFAQLQQRHPFLNAHINHEDEHAPFLHRAENPPIPLTFEVKTSPTQWERVIEAHIEEPFGAAPLVRATLLEDEAGCDLVFTAHHAILDGVGAVALLRDLMAALAGDAMEAMPVPPSAEERLRTMRLSVLPQPPADPQAAEARNQFLASLPVRAFQPYTGTRRPTVSSIGITPEETRQWLACARSHNVTLGAVLIAAMAAAVRQLTPSLKTSDIRIAVPVNNRPHLNNQDDAVLCISIAHIVCVDPDQGLWGTARAVLEQLRQAQGLDAAEQYLEAIKPIMDAKLGAATLVRLLATNNGTDATLTNLKQVDFLRLPDGLSVQAVWGPAVCAPIAPTFVIGAATFNGALRLVYTTHMPLPGMLETLRTIVSRACADA